MKRLFILFAMLVLTGSLLAQAPQKMNYQAVVRNANNSLLANHSVSVRISIVQGSATGAAVFTESHSVQTNANGLMTLEIGGGSIVSGSFDQIDWANGPYFIQSEIDPEGGINYSITTTQQLMSVPYALYAAASGNGEGPQGPQGPQGEPGPAGVGIPQTLSLSGDTLFISEGNSVTLPGGFSGDYNDLTNKPNIPTMPTDLSQLNNDVHFVDNTNCSTVNFCDLYNALTDMQNNFNNRLDSLQNIIGGMQSTISSQDSTINALNNQVNPRVFICGASTVRDHEGNIYNTVKIGNQCWTKENMRCTTSPSTGSYLVNNTNDQVSYSGKMAKWYNNDSTTYAPQGYGLLYNWNAAVDTFNTNFSSNDVSISIVATNVVNAQFSDNRRGICPQGWHVPSDAEWTQMETYVGDQSQFVCDNDNTFIAKALASNTSWDANAEQCAVGNTLSSNNATGFSALPAGFYDNSFNNIGIGACFWSATHPQYSAQTIACRRGIDYDFPDVYRSNDGKELGYSVRCLRDNGNDSVPASNESFASLNVEGGGNISVDPSYQDSYDSLYNDLNARLDSLQMLVAALQNTVSTQDSIIHALNGQDVPQNPFACGTSTITDIDGNVYNTVQIGNQCWMKENLRTAHFADSTEIVLENAINDNIAYRMLPDSNWNLQSYGYLYNWAAVMHDSLSSENNPSGVQGICPQGWHVPSDAEWLQLSDYVESQSQYVCGSDNTNIAKALASTTGWITDESPCNIGNMPDDNNTAGFSAIPVGNYTDSYSGYGISAYFWSATQSNNRRAYSFSLDSSSAIITLFGINKYIGCSVRCLKD